MANLGLSKTCIFIGVFLFCLVNGQHAKSTTPTSTTTTTEEVTDPAAGGRYGNPGAQIRFSTKALDTIYAHAVEKISQAIKSMVVPNVIVPVGGGMLTIKNVRVTEAKIPNFEKHLLPPNKILSRLSGARFVSVGDWEYKPFGGARADATSGIFRTIVVNAEMNITNQLARTWDGKPTVQTTECKANLGDFRVEIEGFGGNTTVIDHCDNLLCKRIRQYFEDSVCYTARNYIKETINQKLATFPTRIDLDPTTDKRFVLDYSLLNGEPKVTEDYIQASLEGDVLSRGATAAPFYANDLVVLDDNKHMISFVLSDFAFNALLHHAHAQQYKFSAFDTLPVKSSLRDLLKLNCSTHAVKSARTFPGGRSTVPSSLCLGSVFDNVSIGNYPPDAVGDLVFKSQRPLAVIVRQPPQKSYFGVSSGLIEAYGPAAAGSGKRELLGRADIQSLRGEFSPKAKAANVTGSVNISDLHLAPASPAPSQARVRSMADPALVKLSQLATPILTEMFNEFLAQFAQFPVPLLEGYECKTPEFHWTQRTMQINCDVTYSPEAKCCAL